MQVWTLVFGLLSWASPKAVRQARPEGALEPARKESHGSPIFNLAGLRCHAACVNPKERLGSGLRRPPTTQSSGSERLRAQCRTG
jgi:hypothetical protein